MMNIITKVGGLFAKKVVQPTNAQKALKVAQVVGNTVKPFAVDAAKFAGGIVAGYGGYKLAIGTIHLVESAQEKVTPAAKATASAVAKAAGNTTAATIGFATGLAHKATGVFVKAKGAVTKKAKAKKAQAEETVLVVEDVI